jgi:hypothetical protein
MATSTSVATTPPWTLPSGVDVLLLRVEQDRRRAVAGLTGAKPDELSEAVLAQCGHLPRIGSGAR